MSEQIRDFLRRTEIVKAVKFDGTNGTEIVALVGTKRTDHSEGDVNNLIVARSAHGWYHLGEGDVVVRYTDNTVDVFPADAFPGKFIDVDLPTDRPRIVVLCGSTKFADVFRSENLRLTLAGDAVFTIGCDMRSDAHLFEGRPAAEVEKTKEGLDVLHKWKIAMGDVVRVLNVGGYIGSSTRSEIEYAQRIGKPIEYLEEVTE